MRPQTVPMVAKTTEVALSRRPLIFSAVAIACAALVTLAIFSGIASAGVDWSISAEISKKPSSLKLSPLDMGSAYDIWAEAIVSSYGVSMGFVRALYERRYDVGEIAMLLEMSRASGKEPGEVVVLRKQGLGWGAIAKRLGVHPASMERAGGRDPLFRRYVLATCLADYYKIPDSGVLLTLHEKGYSFEELALAANVCAHTGSPLNDVIATRQSGAKWKVVAEKFKMSPTKLGTPPKPGSGKAGGQTSGGTKGQSNKKKLSQDCAKTCPRPCF